MADQLDSSEFVLVVCTETYHRRFLGREEPNKGKGANWEGNLITLELYHSRSDTNKFVPVLFFPQDDRSFPGHCPAIPITSLFQKTTTPSCMRS